MINRKLIQKDQAMKAIETGEFENGMLTSTKNVVVLLTQDWCPQWRDMKSWIYEVETDEDIDIYELEYNKTDYFDEFMGFKESKYRNDTVPYLRFYRNGALASETNYIGQGRFKEILNL